jgi:hypothetical protein
MDRVNGANEDFVRAVSSPAEWCDTTFRKNLR